MHEVGQRPRGDRFHILNSTISINSQFPEILKGGKYLYRFDSPQIFHRHNVILPLLQGSWK